jgi:hypothetical protein
MYLVPMPVTPAAFINSLLYGQVVGAIRLHRLMLDWTKTSLIISGKALKFNSLPADI